MVQPETNIRIEIIKENDFNPKEFTSILRAYIENAIRGTDEQIEYRVKGLGKYFTNEARKKLESMRGKKYQASLDLAAHLEHKSIYILSKSKSNPSAKVSGSSGIVRGGNYVFVTKMPTHRGHQYGFSLGNRKNLFRPPIDVLTKWIIDKGGFTYTDKQGTKVEVERPYQARRVAYLMIKARGKKKVKNTAPDWYVISTTTPSIKSRMKSLQNLQIGFLKKELNG